MDARWGTTIARAAVNDDDVALDVAAVAIKRHLASSEQH